MDSFKGVWILREDKDVAEEQYRKEELELNNPDMLYFPQEPVFAINQAPNAAQINKAKELKVPVVVIISRDKFDSIEELFMWQKINIPEIQDICLCMAGSEDIIPIIQNEWRNNIKEAMRKTKIQVKDQYERLKKEFELNKKNPKQKSPKEDKARSHLPNALVELFERLDPSNINKDNDDDEGGFGSPFIRLI